MKSMGRAIRQAALLALVIGMGLGTLNSSLIAPRGSFNVVMENNTAYSLTLKKKLGTLWDTFKTIEPSKKTKIMAAASRGKYKAEHFLLSVPSTKKSSVILSIFMRPDGAVSVHVSDQATKVRMPRAASWIKGQPKKIIQVGGLIVKLASLQKKRNITIMCSISLAPTQKNRS